MDSSASLSILLRAQGATQAANEVKKVDTAIGRLTTRASQGLHAAASNIAKIGLVAGGVLAVGVKSGLESLDSLENATSSVDGAIKQLGLTGKVTSGQVETWAHQIETNISGAFKDQDIVQATATLIRFGHVATSNLQPAMIVMTDLAAKTGDVNSAGTLLAKALADPAKAAGRLARAGVILTKAQQDEIKAFVKAGKTAQAQKVILDALAKTTAGAAAASQGPYKRALSVLSDVTRDAERALAEGFLPVLEKVASLLSTQLAKPEVIQGIRDFGTGLASGLDSVVGIAEKIPWSSIGQALKIGGAGARAVLDAFVAMPSWVQSAVVTGWGLNKLTGGALGGIIGDLGRGLIKGVLGMNAAVVNIKAGVVNGAGGGLPGAGGGKGGGGLAGKIGTGLAVATAALSVAEVVNTYVTVNQATSDQATGLQQTLGAQIAGGASLADLNRSLSAIDTGIAEIRGNPLLVLVQGDALTKLDAMRNDTVAAIGRQTGTIRNADRWWSETASNSGRTSDKVEALRAGLVAKQDTANAELARIAAKREENRINVTIKPGDINIKVAGQKVVRTTTSGYSYSGSTARYAI